MDSDEEWGFNDDSEEPVTEDAYAEYAAKFKPPQILIAIDTHPSMFIPNNEEQTPFKYCIEGCLSLINCLLLHIRRKTLGIVLVNGDENVATLVNFDLSIADTVLTLESIKNMSETEIKKKYLNDDVDFANFLLVCKRKFQMSKIKADSKIILLFTNNADPTNGDNRKRFLAMQEVKNLPVLDLKFQIAALNPDFDYDTFWSEFFEVGTNSLTPVCCLDSDGVLDKLLEHIVPQLHHRKSRFYPFPDEPNRYVEIMIRPMLSSPKFLCNYFFTKDTHAEVKRVPSSETGEFVSKFEVEVNKSETVEMDADELRIFKSSDVLQGYSLVMVSDTISDEGIYNGTQNIMTLHPKETSPFFETVWQYCVDKNKVLICQSKFSRSTRPKLIELIPKYFNNQKSFLTKQICTQEMQTIALENEAPPQIRDTEQQAAQELIELMSFDYNPMSFPDPVFSKQEAYIKSQMLDSQMENPHEVNISDERIDERIGAIGINFAQLFCVEEKKRPSLSQAGGRRKKK